MSRAFGDPVAGSLSRAGADARADHRDHAYVEPAPWGSGTSRRVLVRSVRRRCPPPAPRGVLPPDDVDAADVVARLDGLVLAGGADIEPGAGTARRRTR